MPKLTNIPEPKPVSLWTVEHKPSDKLMAEIRSTLNALDVAGDQHITDFWIEELHLVNGHPNLKRWTNGALYLMQRDLMQAELTTL